MSIHLVLSGNSLVVVEGPSYPAPAEEAAALGAVIVCHEPFPEDNRDIGYAVMRQMLEEAGCPWPRPHEDGAVIEAMIEALEAGRISEARFVDWVCLRVAVAEGPTA